MQDIIIFDYLCSLKLVIYFNISKKMRKKVIENGFKSYYQNLPEEERVRVRDEFLSRSGLVYSSWYGKLQRDAFSKLELESLQEICKKKFIS